MKSKPLTVVVWLVLAAPLIAFGVYELEVVAGPEPGAVTVYVLDRWVARPRPIDARSVTLTTATTPPVVVELAAFPQDGDRTAGHPGSPPRRRR